VLIVFDLDLVVLNLRENAIKDVTKDVIKNVFYWFRRRLMGYVLIYL